MSIISQLVFSVRFDDPDDPTFLSLMKALDDIFERARGNLADFVPLAKYIPTQNLRLLRKAMAVRNHHFSEWIKQHIASLPQVEEPRDYLDHLLWERKAAEEQGDQEKLSLLTDQAIIGVCYDMFAAGTDTTSTTLEWLLLYLAQYPQVQATLQAELDRHFGPPDAQRQLSYREANEVEYLHACINEVLRRGSIAPHLLPHMALQDFVCRGMLIPKGAVLLPNAHYINHQPGLWPEPEEFRPERFQSQPLAAGWGSSAPAAPTAGALLSFGVGPRQCVGLKLAKTELVMFVANLVWKHSFGGEGLDARTQVYGITMQPLPYLLTASPRY